MKNFTLSAALIALIASPLAAAETFDEAFLKYRAMYGSNHSFEWNGETYSTMTMEEELAAKPATKGNAKALLDAAKLKQREAQEVGFAWRDPSKYIAQAEEAMAAGEFQKSMDLSARAHYQARMGVAQAAYAEQNWIKAVPPLN